MKITRSQIRKIVKEAINRNILLEYEEYISRGSDGQLYVGDDEGNEDLYDDFNGEYGFIKSGERVPFDGPSSYAGSRNDSSFQSRGRYSDYDDSY